MKFHHADASVFVPDCQVLGGALARVTHLGIGAHQDDLEFMAFDGIVKCLARDDQWFGGVICTNGAGSARGGPYASFTDECMMAIRRHEQDAAATVGGYGVMIQLGYPSSRVKDPGGRCLEQDLIEILTASQPEVVYTHNPADKHETHVGVTMAALRAMREMPREIRPRKVIGCEVWRGLDWLPDSQKVIMDVSGHDDLAAALNGVFESQIAGGKRYDFATHGRRAANATFFDSHATDSASQLIFGMDLTPLVVDETRDVVGYVADLIGQFNADVCLKLSKQLGLC